MKQTAKEELKYRAYKFSISVIRFVATLSNERVYWVIVDQLVRSATSIGANIIEAQAAASKKDFINFFHIALKSANETKYWLCLLRDGTKVNKEKVSDLVKEADELSRIVGASLITMKKN